jgi:urease accessory protein
MRQKIFKIMIMLLFLPGMALAHTGVGETAGLMHGFSHPISGADHLLAMVAVGLWAAQTGGRALWVVPCTFVGVMILGGILGLSGIPLMFIEEGILLSVLILGILIAGAFRLPLIYSALVVGLFAIFHGYAHGAEIPNSIAAISYTFGFAFSTAILHLAGIGLGMLISKTSMPVINRFAGGAIALSGVYLAVVV